MELKIDGIRVRYTVAGEGKNILLLHGWGGSIESSLPVFNSLKKYTELNPSFKYRIWSMDLPGFGQSDVPPQNWGSFEYAEFVKKFIDNFKMDKVILIGHSFGGRISIILASKYKFLIDKLILIDSAGIIPKRTIKYYTKVYSYKLIKNVLKVFIKDKDKALKIVSKYFGSKDYKQSGRLRKNLVKIVNEDLKHLLSKINVPTLIFWGENDKDTPLYMGKIMNNLISDSGLIVLENAGHFSYLDNFYKFDVVLKKFLSQ